MKNLKDVIFEKDKIEGDLFKKEIINLNKIDDVNIYIPNTKLISWVVIDIKNIGIITLSKAYFGGLDITSCCIPNTESGTGSLIYKNTYKNIYNKICQTANKFYIKSRPYKNIGQYLNKNNIFKYDLLIK